MLRQISEKNFYDLIRILGTRWSLVVKWNSELILSGYHESMYCVTINRLSRLRIDFSRAYLTSRVRIWKAIPSIRWVILGLVINWRSSDCNHKHSCAEIIARKHKLLSKFIVKMRTAHDPRAWFYYPKYNLSEALSVAHVATFVSALSHHVCSTHRLSSINHLLLGNFAVISTVKREFRETM